MSMARRRMWVGDYPEWLDATFARVFGDERAEEVGGHLLRARPLDLRVNTLRAEREAAAKELS